MPKPDIIYNTFRNPKESYKHLDEDVEEDYQTTIKEKKNSKILKD